MEKNKISSSVMLKYLLLIFIIGNSVYALCMFFAGDMGSIKDFVTQTGTIVLLNAALLLLVSCGEVIERKRWDKKVQAAFLGDGSYRLLKCSSGYFMVPVLAILLDILFGSMLWKEYKRDADALMKILQSEEIVFPVVFLIIYNCLCVFVILYYCCYKVCYTGHFIEMVHFLCKKKVAWGQIRKIEYIVLKKSNRKKVVFETGEKRLVLRSELLCNGWEEFIGYVKDMAGKYDINLIMKG